MSNKSVKYGLQHIVQSDQKIEEGARLHEIGEKLRQRLAKVFMGESQPKSQKVAPICTDEVIKTDRLLISWRDLQRAVAQTRQRGKSEGQTPQVPWACDDKEVIRMWRQITHPDNAAALAEWHHQSAAGEQKIWARQALSECRLRAGHRKT